MSEQQTDRNPTRNTTHVSLPQHDLLAKLLASIAASEGRSRAWTKPRVTFVLGTDEEIGGSESPEQRVGITPTHVAQLLRFSEELGFRLDVHVVHDAGARAGWSDRDYERVGANIIHKENISSSALAPDVLHALKEPSLYEVNFQGPFMRIGALHGGDFHPDSGFARLLARRDVALFDGSSIGAPGTFRIPIRGSMSTFAGEIAAEWVISYLNSSQRDGGIVIVGGGNVGSSCARKLAAIRPATYITICESAATPDRLATVAARLGGLPSLKVVAIDGLDHPNLVEALDAAAAVVFAPFKHGSRAPRVASVATLQTHLRENALIVDVSIDERGAIQDDDADDDWPSEELSPWLKARLAAHTYQAVPNMPRAYPREASNAHGTAVLPYLATLLYLSARHGGVRAALDFLRTIDVNAAAADPAVVDASATTAALVQDLRNGLAVYPTSAGLEISDTMPEPDRFAIRAFLDATPREDS